MNPLHLLVRLCVGLTSRTRNFWFRLLGVRLTGYVWLQRVSIPRQWSDITIEGTASLDDGVVLLCSGAPKRDKLVIRGNTYVNRFTIIDAHERVEIGNGCLIGPGCYITDANHGTAAGQSPMIQPCECLPTIIEEEVWLGAKVIVLPGVRIGRGAVVGAGAVVTKNVEPFQIVAGIPARAIGERK
jgi:acetyltransferase-like isoleucine patch superfamily enzyme